VRERCFVIIRDIPPRNDTIEQLIYFAWASESISPEGGKYVQRIRPPITFQLKLNTIIQLDKKVIILVGQEARFINQACELQSLTCKEMENLVNKLKISENFGLGKIIY